MSKTLFAAAIALVVATPAFAQEATPWNLAERNAFVVDMQNKMWSQRVSDKGMKWMTTRARPVPRGTVFFMANGRLMMSKSPMFDRAGNFMAGGV